MKTVEDAYNELAKGIIDFVGGRAWDKALCRCKIYQKMASVNYLLEKFEHINEKALGWPDTSIDSDKAAIFIRDDIFEKSRNRIWGLVFTLHPDGVFNIEYDYNKPEDYELTEDTL